MRMTATGETSVRRVATCHLTASNWHWPFEASAAEPIAANWAKRTAGNPHFFNGRIFMMRNVAFGDPFTADVFETDFAAFLYWRENGFPDASVHDGFGSALLRAADGSIILGRQGFGHINAGLTYLPGGFIDPRDRDANGHIDIAASVAREIGEETGVAPESLKQSPGFIITRCGPSVSIAVEFVSPLATHALLAAISAHIAAGADPELEAAIAVRTTCDLENLAMPPYARPLLQFVFGESGT